MSILYIICSIFFLSKIKDRKTNKKMSVCILFFFFLWNSFTKLNKRKKKNEKRDNLWTSENVATNFSSPTRRKYWKAEPHLLHSSRDSLSKYFRVWIRTQKKNEQKSQVKQNHWHARESQTKHLVRVSVYRAEKHSLLSNHSGKDNEHCSTQWQVRRYK